MKILNPNCEILVTYTRKESPIGYATHLSGHFFELFDYYYILSSKFKTKILIPENVELERIERILKSHYSIEFNLNDIIIGYDYELIKVPIVLNVDDCHFFLNLNRKKFLCEKFFSFACGDSYFFPNVELLDIIRLADYAIYNELPNSINYTKKILPHLKRIENDNQKEFVHLTKNCRSLNSEKLGQLILEHPNLLIYTDYLPKSLELEYPSVSVSYEPIENFNFKKFIYTPISRKFDCSPRLILECEILGIPVEYFCIDYIDEGLERRRFGDIDDFILNSNDEIFEIINTQN